MEPTLEQRARICFAHDSEGTEALLRIQGTIREAYLHRSSFGDPLGLMFHVVYDNELFGTMKCTNMEAVDGLMEDLSVNTPQDLVGKSVIAYHRSYESGAKLIALSKFQYDI